MPHESKYETAVVIVAAGKGLRFNYHSKKQFSMVLGHPVLAWTIIAFVQTLWKNHIYVVAAKKDIEIIQNDILRHYSFCPKLQFVEGGATRQESVYNGLASLSPDIQWVAIHDGVRPAVRPEFITAVCKEAFRSGAALLAVPVTDSTFITTAKTIDTYVDRNTLWHAQTPQVFEKNQIVAAHQKAREDNFWASDDAILYRKYIGDVSVVEGDAANIKITYPRDLVTAEEILKERKTYPQ